MKERSSKSGREMDKGLIQVVYWRKKGMSYENVRARASLVMEETQIC